MWSFSLLVWYQIYHTNSKWTPSMAFAVNSCCSSGIYKQTFDYKEHYFWDASKSMSLHRHWIIQLKALILQLCNIYANCESDIALSLVCVLLSLSAAVDAFNIWCPLMNGYLVTMLGMYSSVSERHRLHSKKDRHLKVTLCISSFQKLTFNLYYSAQYFGLQWKSSQETNFFLLWRDMNTAWHTGQSQLFF